jgi:hypothetical protein
MESEIRDLSDRRATWILTTIAEHVPAPGGDEVELTAELREALARQLEVRPQGEPASDGDVAREALVLLAQDSTLGPAVTAMVENPAPMRMALEPTSALVLAAAVLMVLKTHFEIKRDAQGCWTFQLKSPALDKGLLKRFVETLLSWIPPGPFGPKK